MNTVAAETLKHLIQGEVDFSDAAISLYTSDASNYRQVPTGVAYPRSLEDIVAIVALCHEHEVAILMRGAGTSQNGQCVNAALVIDCSRHLNQVVDLDPDTQIATVEPGIVCDSLKSVAEQHALTFGPDPATHSRCTLGGMIGNNSCGPRSMLAGKTVENVEALEVLTSDGARFWVGPTTDDQLKTILSTDSRQAKIYAELLAIRDEYADDIRQHFPNIKRRVSGYNLDQLLPENGFNVARALVGSEGTCVSVLQAKVRLIEKPTVTQLVVLGFDDIFLAGDAVGDIMSHSPIAMEGLDWGIVGGLNDRNLKSREVALLPEGRAWMLVELADSNTDALQPRVEAFVASMLSNRKVRAAKAVHSKADETAIWSIREQGASATAMSLDPEGIDPVVGWEDTAVDPLQLGDYLRDFKALVDQYGYTTSLYGHFGDGCIHARITFDTRTVSGVAHWREFSKQIAHLVVQYGGSLSGEHGDGQAKAEFLPIMFGDRLMQAFRRFKAAWDPASLMNPGKLIDAYRMDENLRFGPGYETPKVVTQLHFSEDPQGFGRSTERCIGMGKCRAHTGAMCPSYQATNEEKYSTRGRAHLLHELVRGDVLKSGWKDTDVADSMEHCLSCKACKSECPTGVDIASYKAEFMQRHYVDKKRPLHHQLINRIGQWLPYLAKAPLTANVLQRGITGSLFKRLAGIDHDKTLPTIATQSFTQWARQTSNYQDKNFYWFGQPDAPAVVLWSDSVNTHYRPAIAQSTVQVLLKTGWRVAVAREHFCCGRPLYEVGLLDQAARQLQSIIDGFYSTLPNQAKVLVLEPSCLSVFKDELLRMFPNDVMAHDLSVRCQSVSAFLAGQQMTLQRKLKQAVIHLHCHDKSLGLADSDRQLMDACCEHVHEVESGCCGMAGSYGMRSKTRHIGQYLFDRALGPAVKQADQHTVIVANGFSCQAQIRDNTQRRVLHPIEVLAACL